jgi:Flp pilus assembly protein TadD
MRLSPIAVVLAVLASAALGQTPPLPVDSQQLDQSAIQSFEQGDYAAAEKTYELMLTIHPNDVHALDDLAMVKMKEGEPDAARTALEQAVALAPTDALIHYNLGMILWEGGKYDAATGEFNKVLALDPQNRPMQNSIRLIRQTKYQFLPFGDFDTPHERRALLDEGQIGLPATFPQ